MYFEVLHLTHRVPLGSVRVLCIAPNLAHVLRAVVDAQLDRLLTAIPRRYEEQVDSHLLSSDYLSAANPRTALPAAVGLRRVFSKTVLRFFVYIEPQYQGIVETSLRMTGHLVRVLVQVAVACQPLHRELHAVKSLAHGENISSAGNGG